MARDQYTPKHRAEVPPQKEVVRVFDPEGRLVMQFPIEGMRVVQVRQMKNGGVQVEGFR